MEGGKLTGNMPGFGRRETPIKNGEVYFEVERGRDDLKSTQKFQGMLEGDSIKGEFETNFGGDPQTAEWLAQRSE